MQVLRHVREAASERAVPVRFVTIFVTSSCIRLQKSFSIISYLIVSERFAEFDEAMAQMLHVYG